VKEQKMNSKKISSIVLTAIMVFFLAVTPVCAHWGTPIQLTHNTAEDIEPSISGDGSKIAFQSEVDGDFEIFVINSDGTDLTQLTDNTIPDEYPSISADGSTIAFRSIVDDEGKIFVINSDGTLTQLADNAQKFGADGRPSISADGSKIAFGGVGGFFYEIFVIDSDGSGVLTQLTHNVEKACYPSISGDGSKIAFINTSTVGTDKDWEIFVINSDGTGLAQLTDNTAQDSHPSISTDGSKIAFHSDVDGDFEIFVIDSDGTNLAQLTDNTTGDWSPSISADGSKIAFSSSGSKIFVINSDGTGLAQVTDIYAAAPSISADGKTIAFESDDGDGEIFVVSYNEIPVADPNGPYTGFEGSQITFYGTGSYDPDGIIVNYEWDFGDGETATGATPTHAYGDNGEYAVTLRVTDDDGGVGTDTSIVTVDNVAPTASIDSVEPDAYFILPYHDLTFTGSFTDPGWLDTYTIEWDFGDLVTATGALTPTHAYSLNGVYLVTLTVTDDDDGIGTDNIEIAILSEEEAITTVDDNIQDLPDDAFKINPDQRKNALSEKLDEVNGLIEAGEYQEAIEKLQNDIRAKADGHVDGNPVNDWITDPDEQQELCMMIDYLIAYLETLL
jgi:Tol biopolymer transport system component